MDQAISQTGSGLRHLHDKRAIRVYNGGNHDEEVARAAQDLLSA
ncbi:hypothetical protein [Streptomyces griseoruber]|nr:hypothetical protein [Streptomyces griseoruber]